MINNLMLQHTINLPTTKPQQYSNYVVKDYRPSIQQLNSPKFYDAIPTDYSSTKKRHITPNSYSSHNHAQQELVSI